MSWISYEPHATVQSLSLGYLGIRPGPPQHAPYFVHSETSSLVRCIFIFCTSEKEKRLPIKLGHATDLRRILCS